MVKTAQSNRSTGISIAVLSAVAFGLYPPMARLVYADGGNQTLVILVTTFARAFSLGGFCVLTGRRLFTSKSRLRLALNGGFFQAVSIFGIFSAMRYLPGAVVIVLIFTHTLMLMFFLAWKGHLKIYASTILTTLTALAGLSLVLDLWVNVRGLSVIGVLFGLMSAVATMSRLYAYQEQTKQQDPAVVGAENFLFAFLFVLPFFFLEAPILPAHPQSYVHLLLACISLVLGTFGMFYGIALLGSFRFSLVIKLEPLFTTLFGVWLAGEYLQRSQYAGIVILISSLIAFQVFDSRRGNGSADPSSSTEKP